MSAPAIDPGTGVQGFRRRLLDGLVISIEERGYRETTVADIVRCARTSKRTFYDNFATKEDCFVELLDANNEDLVLTVRAAVDPTATWVEQVSQAVTAFVRSLESNPAVTMSWIRELPAIGEGARPMLRRGFARLTAMLIDLSESPGFQRDGVGPLSPAAAVIMVGGLRELAAQTVEDGLGVTDMIAPAVSVSTALLRGAH